MTDFECWKCQSLQDLNSPWARVKQSSLQGCHTLSLCERPGGSSSADKHRWENVVKSKLSSKQTFPNRTPRLMLQLECCCSTAARGEKPDTALVALVTKTSNHASLGLRELSFASARLLCWAGSSALEASSAEDLSFVPFTDFDMWRDWKISNNNRNLLALGTKSGNHDWGLRWVWASASQFHEQVRSFASKLEKIDSTQRSYSFNDNLSANLLMIFI